MKHGYKDSSPAMGTSPKTSFKGGGLQGTWDTFPVMGEDSILGPKPVNWFGTADRDGDANPWDQVPPGSKYLYMNGDTPKLYIKDTETNTDGSPGHDDDWGFFAFTT